MTDEQKKLITKAVRDVLESYGDDLTDGFFYYLEGNGWIDEKNHGSDNWSEEKLKKTQDDRLNEICFELAKAAVKTAFKAVREAT